MDVKGAVFAGLVLFAAVYVLLYQDPLFMANSSSVTTFNVQQVNLSPALPESPPTPWGNAALSYACDDAGPGIIQIRYTGQSTFTVVGLALTYGGATHTASGPSCPVGQGTTVISVRALGAPATGQGSPYTGYLVAADGTRIPFSGSWI